MLSFQTQPYTLKPEECDPFYLFGTQVFLKASTKQTGGAFNLFEAACQPGFSTPLHIHYVEDVAIYVVEGALTFFWGSERKKAGIGAYLFTPRCVPQGFRVDGEHPARILYLAIPAGLDRFLMEQEQSAPKPQLSTAAARFKIEILGPLPE